MRAFLDAVRWFPSNATVVKKYRHLPILKMIEAGKRDKVPAPSTYTLNKHNQKPGSFFNGLVNQDLICTVGHLIPCWLRRGSTGSLLRRADQTVRV